MTFTDSFTRADEDLEADANWTRVDGAAGAAKIVGNLVRQASDTDSAYQCPDQGSANHYSQVLNLETGPASTTGFAPCNRLTSITAYIGVRNTGGDWEMFLQDSGFTELGTAYTSTPLNTDVLKLESDGNDHVFYLNGTSRITATNATHNTVTRQGVANRFNGSDWFDDFEAGLLGASSVLTGTMTATVDEDDITTGGKTIIVTLTNDTFKAAGTGPIGSTADTQALIDGFDAAASPTNGWNNEVRDKALTSEVVRTSSTVATWTVAAQSGYDVTITGTIPTAVLVTGAGAITATPTFTVDAVAAGATLHQTTNYQGMNRMNGAMR